MEKINTMALIKELRERTDAPMVDCKKALEASSWDVEKAIVWLQENGKAKAAKKASRVAAEGLVSAKADEKSAVIFEINSETDFVAQNKQFIELVDKVGKILLNNSFTSSEEALKLKDENGKTIEELTTDATATIGEKIAFRRAEKINLAANQKAGAYIHTNGRVASIVLVEGNDAEAARNVSMHVAAMNPEFTFVTDIPAQKMQEYRSEAEQEVKEEIAKKQAAKPGSPVPNEKIQENMIEGKVSKKIAPFVLEIQEFVMDSSFKVNSYLKSKGNTLVKSIRFEVGEGIEKEVTDFAAEVAAQVAEASKK